MPEDKSLDQLAHEAQLAYAREYRRKHPDRIRETNRRYWLKKAEELRKKIEEGKANE